MALLTINGVGVIGGSIVMPQIGVWTADLVIDQPDGSGFAAGTKVTISASDFELKGTVTPDRTGDFLDAVHVRVTGGNGGMATVGTPRGYVQPGALVRDVMNGFARDSGETLSSDISTAFMATNLIAWSAIQQPVSQALGTLIDFVSPGMSWRILSDGTLWVGPETWPKATPEFTVIGQNPSEGTFDLGVDSPSIIPGTTIDEVGHVNRVEHQISAGEIRSHVRVNFEGVERGFNAAISSLVSQATAFVDYFGLYECKVQSQSADLGTVDIQPLPPVNTKLPGLSRVQVRAGSGIKCQFAQGAKVLLGWEGGNPTLPYVCLGVGTDSVQRIQLGGNTDVARRGDGCDGGTLVFFPGTGAATLSYIPPGAPVPPATPPTINIPMSPKINEGSSIVGAG